MPPAAIGPMSGKDWGALVALSVLWGGSFFFNAVAVGALPVLTIVAARVSIAAAILLVVAGATGAALPRGRTAWSACLVMAMLSNVIPFSLIVWSQQFLASGVAAVLNATTPLFTVVLAHWLTRDERLTGGRIAGALVGLAGVAVLMGPAALSGLGGALPAQLAGLAAATSYALAAIYGRRFRTLGVTPLAAATGQLMMASLVLVPLAAAVDAPWRLGYPGPAALGAILGLAALSTALAYLIYFRLLASAGATNAALVTLLVPVSAILLGVVALGERLTLQEVGGMALIALGLSAIDGRLWRALKRPTVRRRSTD
ncbi:DMT family transporter [Amaricoccus sp.]|uniref:DMT family transporter n=1 Tax=Amaricoccus sp. TaxID=1872485 RepID=UPI001B6C14FD|nr:DMT family transporter [Amaricoccus sp.]MBP7001385.1 DMT family transporter [Amaricoccus sp.]